MAVRGLPYEKKTDKEDGYYTPMQVFAPDLISGSLTSHDVTDILVVRTTTDAIYYINSASGLTAAVAAGTVIGIADGVTTLVFAQAQVLEMMSVPTL